MGLSLDTEDGAEVIGACERILEGGGCTVHLPLITVPPPLMAPRYPRIAGKSPDSPAVSGPAEVGRIRVHITPHRDLNAEFQRELLELIDQQGLSGEVLEIEITERMALQDRGQFDPLREQDVRLAIDDFGTGYSSLFYLPKLEADTLKIDPYFIQQIDTDDRTPGLVEAMPEIADRFDMDVVAEGLETTDQRDRLEQMNCPMAQGFLFARPMPPDRIEEFLFEPSEPAH